MIYSSDNQNQKQNDDGDDENGKVVSSPTEEYTHLGGGAYLDENSGKIVDQSAILPQDDDDNGSIDPKSN